MLTGLLLTTEATIRDAMTAIDQNRKGIVLLVDEQRHLKKTVTDGDIRRAILMGIDLDSPLELLLQDQQKIADSKPVTALLGIGIEELLLLMQQHRIRQIPILDDDDRVVDLATMDELLPNAELPLHAVIMAGGYGKRLRPLTEDLPKPMLPVGDRPLLERTIARLRSSGIRRVQISTHYMKDKITDYFGDGEAFGVELNYVTEEQPLGTAGALGLMEISEDPVLVMNGDILTQVDFRAMLDFHCHHDADMTIAVRQYGVEVPYGVVETDGVNVRRIVEKPTMKNFINAGIYLLSPDAHRRIPHSRRFDMPELIDMLIQEERTVICFPVREYWKDIGQFEDYHQAEADFARGGVGELQGVSA
ncbi:nucleotidyltransferase family protein [bacterium]|nr:nucleotidyltransferase family protein [bacterium]MBU1650974.1 nucleotidyltransferase family protein [bacterium]